MVHLNVAAMNSQIDTQKDHIPGIWEKEGFYILPNAVSEENCIHLKQEGLRVLREHAKESSSVYVGCAAVSRPFAALAENRAILEVLKILMPDGIEFLSDKIVFKKPGKSAPTPWHLDAWYWPGTRPKISVWIPFEDTCAEGGTLVVAPGSHLRSWRVEEVKGGGEFTRQLPKDAAPREGVRVCEIKRGTALFFPDTLLHGSTASTGDRERYAIISTYHAPGDEPFDQRFPARKVLSSANA